MELHSWKGVGFTFAIEMSEDGLPRVKVIDPWYNKGNDGDQPAPTLSLKLRPYTSYTEAQEIAAFINRRVQQGTMPLLEVGVA